MAASPNSHDLAHAPGWVELTFALRVRGGAWGKKMPALRALRGARVKATTCPALLHANELVQLCHHSL